MRQTKFTAIGPAHPSQVALATSTTVPGSAKRSAMSAGTCEASICASSEPHQFWMACKEAVATNGPHRNVRATEDA